VIPIAGDWDGNRTTTVGLVNSNGHHLYGGSATPTSTEALAAELLSRWGRSLSGNTVVYNDLLAASRGEYITNSDSCWSSVKLDPRLLTVLLKATDRYHVIAWNIITGHGCDQYQHPKGRAFDLGGISDPLTGASTNLADGTAGDDPALDKALVEFLARNAPAGSQIGQSNCPGRAGASIPAGIEFFPDTCNHQHFNVV
jgi:hypothetical protein